MQRARIEYRVIILSHSGDDICIAFHQIINDLINEILICRAPGTVEKQLDSLYRHEALDIQTDIDVLETMLAADGLRAEDGKKEEETTHV